ncbi:MAG: cation:proton antiporter [bacterium]
MEQFNLIVLVISLLVLGVGLLSHQVKRTPLSPPLVAFGVGLIVGPLILRVMDVGGGPIHQGVLLEQGSRLALAVGLMGIALRLPPRYFFHNARCMTVVLGGLMTLMWLASSLIAYALLGLPLYGALLLGAVLTPTDPILATSVVGLSPFLRLRPQRPAHRPQGTCPVTCRGAFSSRPATPSRRWRRSIRPTP